MKFILELILTTVIIFFVWNILKRLFFTAVFKFPKPNNAEEKRQEKSKKKAEVQNYLGRGNGGLRRSRRKETKIIL